MKQTTLRLPDDLFEALSAEASADGRSLNWVIHQKLSGVVSPVGKRKHRGPKSSDSPAAKEQRPEIPNEMPLAVRAFDPAAGTFTVTREPCDHPPARVLRGQCQACGERVE